MCFSSARFLVGLSIDSYITHSGIMKTSRVREWKQEKSMYPHGKHRYSANLGQPIQFQRLDIKFCDKFAIFSNFSFPYHQRTRTSEGRKNKKMRKQELPKLFVWRCPKNSDFFFGSAWCRGQSTVYRFPANSSTIFFLNWRHRLRNRDCTSQFWLPFRTLQVR